MTDSEDAWDVAVRAAIMKCQKLGERSDSVFLGVRSKDGSKSRTFTTADLDGYAGPNWVKWSASAKSCIEKNALEARLANVEVEENPQAVTFTSLKLKEQQQLLTQLMEYLNSHRPPYTMTTTAEFRRSAPWYPAELQYESPTQMGEQQCGVLWMAMVNHFSCSNMKAVVETIDASAKSKVYLRSAISSAYYTGAPGKCCQ